jgi:hypothetical protein
MYSILLIPLSEWDYFSSNYFPSSQCTSLSCLPGGTYGPLTFLSIFFFSSNQTRSRINSPKMLKNTTPKAVPFNNHSWHFYCLSNTLSILMNSASNYPHYQPNTFPSPIHLSPCLFHQSKSTYHIFPLLQRQSYVHFTFRQPAILGCTSLCTTFQLQSTLQIRF